MPSCHSVYDLELLAVQDLWAHLPQDNIASREYSKNQIHKNSSLLSQKPSSNDRVIDCLLTTQFEVTKGRLEEDLFPGGKGENILHSKMSIEHRFKRRTATAGSDVVQSGRPIFDDFFQHLWLYIGNNTANVVFQMIKRLWLIRIDQWLYIAPQKIV
ncbi:hypothetical protein TNCV_4351551 [Trichonephila clavipes]|nr:hypothetical protein TNCV_4351551 [Trichonephila clavipes]